MGRKNSSNEMAKQPNQDVSKKSQSALGKSEAEGENSSSSDDRRKYSKRKMDTNWSKYDEPMDTTSNVAKGLDFSQYTDKKPSGTAGDSHFRFSSERGWDTVLDEKVSDYFKLNVKDLCSEIMCVPLHERLKLKSAVLTQEQVDTFEDDARLCRLRIEEQNPITKKIEDKMVSLLKEGNSDGLQDSNSDESSWLSSLHGEEQSDKQTTWHDNSENFFSLSGLDQELDMILSMPLPSTEPKGMLFFFSIYSIHSFIYTGTLFIFL